MKTLKELDTQKITDMDYETSYAKQHSLNNASLLELEKLVGKEVYLAQHELKHLTAPPIKVILKSGNLNRVSAPHDNSPNHRFHMSHVLEITEEGVTWPLTAAVCLLFIKEEDALCSQLEMLSNEISARRKAIEAMDARRDTLIELLDTVRED